MSDIFGIFHTDGKPVAREHLELRATGLSFIQANGIDLLHDRPVDKGQLKPYGSSPSSHDESPLQNSVNNIIVAADTRLDNRRALLGRLKYWVSWSPALFLIKLLINMSRL